MAVINFGFSNASRRQKVWAKNIVYYNRVSAGILPVAPMVLSLTDTVDQMHAPINCVLVGHQQPIGRAIGLEGIPSSMKGIFGE